MSTPAASTPSAGDVRGQARFDISNYKPGEFSPIVGGTNSLGRCRVGVNMQSPFGPCSKWPLGQCTTGGGCTYSHANNVAPPVTAPISLQQAVASSVDPSAPPSVGEPATSAPSTGGIIGQAEHVVAWASAQAIVVDQYKARIMAVYAEHSPEKQGAVSDLIKMHHGTEHELYIKVCAKFKTTPKSRIHPRLLPAPPIATPKPPLPSELAAVSPMSQLAAASPTSLTDFARPMTAAERNEEEYWNSPVEQE